MTNLGQLTVKGGLSSKILSVRKNKFFKSRDYKACLRKNSKTLTDKNKMVIIKNGLKLMMILFKNLFMSVQLCLAVF